MAQELTSAGKPFSHLHSAHCESGVTAALFRDKGINISEAMAFGIGSGIFFGHLPFIKWVGLPITTYRSRPGTLFSKVAKRLGGEFITKKYHRFWWSGDITKQGMDDLRRLLREGNIVGLTTNIYWLSYFPDRFRFQFNGHNIIVLREIENGFRVADPVLDHPVDCLAEDLERARFARGPLEPKGYMYYAKSVRPDPDFRSACITAMKDSCNMMLRTPFPYVGLRGIRYLAKVTIKSPDILEAHEARRRLANIVRMQEEVGTGGAGFRFMYAAFLQETADLFGSSELADLSREMTAIGDIWREFAVVSARIIKQRGQTEETFAKAGGLMLICAGREEQLFRDLDKVARNLKS
ncbi:MAG: BtrH N-terminal domain-containing protein [Smithellaceae bacterium]|nr:BtrH N-terminal domain-containing protein [Syntrophaceae bacterium]MDD4241411.1 BtrH N-terminal domain-containing protein [Smithellaceae bacterium]NLX51056.1 BtrH N-terminal domain-containing protein [Deltaproteobacteria bacterium]